MQFEDAALSFDGLARGNEPAGLDVSGVLSEFGLEAWASAEEGSFRHRAALLRVAGRMSRIFRLPVPDAPGLAFVGGTAAPAAYGFDPATVPLANVSGRGVAADAAFESCVGEAVEHLSRLEWGDEHLERRGSEALAGLRPATAAAIGARLRDCSADWMPALRLHDGAVCAVPADLCLVRPSSNVSPPSSSGCAAGGSWDAACLTATLELVERDAAALWWCGGRLAKPLAPEMILAGLGPVLDAVQRGRTARRTWLLDITTDLGIPAVAAVSVEPDGFGLACGLAARTSAHDAARAAFLELCQMELANRLVALKLSRDGPRALAPVEIRHRRRMEAIAADNPILATSGPPRFTCEEPAPADVHGRLGWISAHLAKQGIDCLAVDLTRPAIGVPAVCVVAPLLQTFPVTVRTERLSATVMANAERSRYTQDIDLI